MRRVMMSWGLLLPLLAVGAMSCGGGSSPYTAGSVCNQIGSAYCSRGVECGAFASVSVCKADFYDGCCAYYQECGEVIPAEFEAEVKQVVAECAASFDRYTCTELANTNGVTPECADYYYAQLSSLSAPALTAEKVARPATLVDAKPLSKQSEVFKLGQKYGRSLPRLSADVLVK